MKNIALTLALLTSPFLFAQSSISGQAYYESKTTVDMDNWGAGRDGNQMTEERKKQIAARMKSMLEKTFILTFNGNESVYEEQEVLETGADQMRGMRMMMGSFTPGVQYKHTKDKVLLEEREFFGKQFLIVDTIPDLQWTVTKESKQIGQYLAIKATATKKIEEIEFSFARRRGGRASETNEEVKKDSTTVSEDPLNEIEVPEQLTVTAWFTPQIPVSNGPAEYGGLPGLILEMNIDRVTILCSKIVLNPENVKPIKKPAKGKEVSREEFNAIVKEKTEEMRENFRGRGGRGGGRFGG